MSDNPNFAFRIVAEFESTASGTANDLYIGTTGTYNTGGTIRFDLISVFGNASSGVTRIPLRFQRLDNNVVLTWSNPLFRLYSAPTANGSYTEAIGATSPYTNSMTGTQKYFRLRY